MTERIMLRKGRGQRYDEVGAVVRESGKLYTVRKADGTTEDLLLSGHMLVVRGGINHILRIYPHEFPRLFESYPDAVVDQILRELAEPLSAVAIKKKLKGLPLDPDAVDAVWSRLKKRMDSSSDIGVSNAKPPQYQWKGEHPPDGLLSHLSIPLEPRTISTPVATPSPDALGQPADVTSGSPSVLEDPHPAKRVSDGSDEVRMRAGTDPTPLASLVQELGGPSDISGDGQVATRLLECAAAMRTATDEDLKTLLTFEGPSRDTARALLAALPRGARLLGASESPLDDVSAAAVLELVAGELARADDSSREALGVPAVALIERLMTPPQPARLPVSLLVRLVVVLSTHVANPQRELSERLLTILAERLRGESNHASNLLQDDLRAVARAVGRLPLDARGARSLFIAALFHAQPAVARQPIWWATADFAGLSAAAAGPLSRALSDEVIGQKYVAPVVVAYMEVMSTRRGLAAILGSPPELARHVSGDALRRVWARVSEADEQALVWLDVLTARAEKDGLRASSDRAREDAEVARGLLGSADAKVESLELELDHLDSQLRDLRGQAHEASAAHDRQLKLDVITSLANLAITVLQSPAARADAALVQTIEYITAREGLSPIEAQGADVSFHPAQHDSLGRTIMPGSPVLVLRPGYTYESAGEAIVLIKAHVSQT
ncbi:hypothetical protein KRR39_05465 [Nocardioides panacis]|uniref:Nucleotide exchange factor GrpE n=1 Tax=Nocardioides panacis TaxID=2849501 RepID=A0A975T0M7_9ACTN|nr:hypothetical protein [Nocardioides panacis]QWZ09237.1 hypothetical protein KRR39_05465 [Nocardioides panacis]